MTQAEKETQGKECSNLIVLLSELYNFQVISCVLVFDIIRGLLDHNISEFNVELLLKIVRSMWLLSHLLVIDYDNFSNQTPANSFAWMIPLRSKILSKLSKTNYPTTTMH
jgi:hypothetical protein